MTKKLPGRAFRKGITLKQIPRMFPDDKMTEAWCVDRRWPNGMCCPERGSGNVQTGCKHKTLWWPVLLELSFRDSPRTRSLQHEIGQFLQC